MKMGSMKTTFCACGNVKSPTAQQCVVCRRSETNRNLDITEAQIAWLAGILEGEGCWTTASNEYNLRIAVKMTDKDIIQRLHDITGVGTLNDNQPREKPHHKQAYCWFVSKATDVLWVTELVYPWLGERRQAKIDTNGLLDRNTETCYGPTHSPTRKGTT